MIKKINIAEKFDLFDEIWVPKIAAEMNVDCYFTSVLLCFVSLALKKPGNLLVVHQAV